MKSSEQDDKEYVNKDWCENQTLLGRVGRIVDRKIDDIVGFYPSSCDQNRIGEQEILGGCDP